MLSQAKAKAEAAGRKMGSRQASTSSSMSPITRTPTQGEEEEEDSRERQVMLTLSLLQAFHANSCDWLSRLATFLPPPNSNSNSESPGAGTTMDTGIQQTISLTSKDVASFGLGPFSTLDSQFVEWLGEEYAGSGVKVEVKRPGLKDVVDVVFGL